MNDIVWLNLKEWITFVWSISHLGTTLPNRASAIKQSKYSFYLTDSFIFFGFASKSLDSTFYRCNIKIYTTLSIQWWNEFKVITDNMTIYFKSKNASFKRHSMWAMAVLCKLYYVIFCVIFSSISLWKIERKNKNIFKKGVWENLSTPR